MYTDYMDTGTRPNRPSGIMKEIEENRNEGYDTVVVIAGKYYTGHQYENLGRFPKGRVKLLVVSNADIFIESHLTNI